jgi:hypothetical protein
MDSIAHRIEDRPMTIRFTASLPAAALLILATACGPLDLGGDEPTTWETDASGHRHELDANFTYVCPAAGTAQSIWGTDIYTDDSSVCTAAVHAGKLTLAGGGTVTIKMQADPGSYTGSTRNGITSGDYPSWENAFIFP